jgi:hypothetical protein
MTSMQSDYSDQGSFSALLRSLAEAETAAYEIWQRASIEDERSAFAAYRAARRQTFEAVHGRAVGQVTRPSRQG